MHCLQLFLLLCGLSVSWADKMTATVLVAPGFEEVGLITLVTELRRFDFEVKLARLDNSSEVVYGAEDIGIVTDSLLPTDQEPPSDVIILPGGNQSVQRMRTTPELRAILEAYELEEKSVVAIGEAPLVLMEFDLFPDYTLTARLSLTAELSTKYKIDSNPVVRYKNLFTCQGPRHTFKLASKLMKELLDKSEMDKKPNDFKKANGPFDNGKNKKT